MKKTIFFLFFMLLQVSYSQWEKVGDWKDGTNLISEIQSYGDNLIVKQHWLFLRNKDNGKTLEKMKVPNQHFHPFLLSNEDFSSRTDTRYLTVMDKPSINEKVEWNYLYATPPYPNPAKSYVKSKIYWDTSIDIANDDIGVYNIDGLEIGSKRDIQIDKQASYTGILTWNCPNMIPNGLYIIKITHGDRTIAIKIILNR